MRARVGAVRGQCPVSAGAGFRRANSTSRRSPMSPAEPHEPFDWWRVAFAACVLIVLALAVALWLWGR